MTRKRNLRPRGLVAFIVFGGFAVMTITGLVLFVTPPGRVAYWTNWAMLGLEKTDWAAVHIVFSLLFVLAGLIHLFFNWKPFKHYLLNKLAGRLQLRAEGIIGATAVGVILVGTLLAWPPFSWIINLNETLKDSWAAAGWAEPPFGHAEDVILKVLGMRTGMEPRAMLEALRDAGFRVDGPGQKVEDIATANGVTPALLVGGHHRTRSAGSARAAERQYHGGRSRVAVRRDGPRPEDRRRDFGNHGGTSGDHSGTPRRRRDRRRARRQIEGGGQGP